MPGWQGSKLAGFITIVLDENEIPNLHHFRDSCIDHFCGCSPVRRAVDVYLRARSARSGFAHFPKIIFFAKA